MKEGNHPIKLFIGGLPGAITAEELMAALGNPRSVQIKIKRRRDAATSLGYAFLTYSDHLLASEMANKTYDVAGRKLTLQYCKSEQPELFQCSMEFGRLFIRGIPLDMTDEELTQFFKSLTPCRSAYAIRKGSGPHQGFGFIDLWSQSDADYLATWKTIEFRGKTLELEAYKPKFKKNQKSKLTPNEAADQQQQFIGKDTSSNSLRQQIKACSAEDESSCVHDANISQFIVYQPSLAPTGISFGQPMAGLSPKHQHLRCSERRQEVQESLLDSKTSVTNCRPSTAKVACGEQESQVMGNRPHFMKSSQRRKNFRAFITMNTEDYKHGLENVRFNVLDRRL